MTRLVLVAALLLTACAAPGTATAPAPSASPTPSAERSADLQGDLPVIDGLANATGDIQLAGGFVHLPGGAFAADPKAAMVRDPRQLWRTAAEPYLFGTNDSGRGRITYDPAVERWLPVARDQVSADGLHYAYAEPLFLASASPQTGPGPFITGVHIRVVDLPAGSDRIVFSSEGPPFYTVVAYAAEGIYLTAACVEGCGRDSLKLWRLDAATGRLAKISDRQGFGWLVRDRVAWVATYDEANPSSELMRLDLITGQMTTWLTNSGMQMIGIDASGSPLVLLHDAGASTLVRVTAAQKSEVLFPRSTNGHLGWAVADGSRTWFGGGPSGSVGIYLYTRESGVRKVSDFPGLPLGPRR